MQQETAKEQNLRPLVIRAFVVIAVVVSVLLTLRCLGITVIERDLPAPVVEEEITRESTPAVSAAES